MMSNKRTGWSWGIPRCVFLGFAVCAVSAPSEETRPNVLLIMTDVDGVRLERVAESADRAATESREFRAAMAAHHPIDTCMSPQYACSVTADPEIRL